MSQQPRLMFTTSIGKPAASRKRRNTQQQQQQPINTWGQTSLTLPSAQASHDIRRQRMTHAIRKACIKIVYEMLDPNLEGKVQRQAIDDIAHELEYLAKDCGSNDTRETERFLVEHGEDTLNEINREERKAHQCAKDLNSTSEDDDDDESQSEDQEEDSCLGGFIVADDYLSSDEEPPHGDLLLHSEDNNDNKTSKQRRRNNNKIVDDDDGTDINTVD